MSAADGLPVKNRHGKTVGNVEKVDRVDDTTFVTLAIRDTAIQKILTIPDILDYLYIGIEDRRRS